MISVIIPIYNVEKYLCKCIESVLAQSYRDLEILLIDDGSTDASGSICDSFDDERIRVIHTKNRGLSAARNMGLDNSHGEYISFIDGDDWIDQNLYKQAMKEIGQESILCFGYTIESLNNSYSRVYTPASYSGINTLLALINGQLTSLVWDKLYRRECFNSIRFPVGRTCEDFATMYKLFLQGFSVKAISKCLYHYSVRKGSISNSHSERKNYDFWCAVRDQYYDCVDYVDQNAKLKLVSMCGRAICRAWAWKNITKQKERESNNHVDASFYSEMTSFVYHHFPYSIRCHQPIDVRLGLFLARFNCPISFAAASILLRIKYMVLRKPIE